MLSRSNLALGIFIIGPPIVYMLVAWWISVLIQSNWPLWGMGIFVIIWLLGICWAAFYPLPVKGELDEGF
ncbi:MAG: hypothetical protein UZ21_OP11001000868 [Microgenomates bacterium OLB22]|nr:MAG: hypothetical protein UZ21_OP11001000868 [Microgenomates bacterium OLB22]